MKLNIPKCQCSFTLLTTVCIVGGVTSQSLSQVFLNISQQNVAKTIKRTRSHLHLKLVDITNKTSNITLKHELMLSSLVSFHSPQWPVP